MPLTNGIYHEGRGQGDLPLLICSPDFASSGAIWETNAKALSQHFRVIMYDHRGTARSDRNFQAPATITGMADDVVKLMDALDFEDAHFMGLGMGGLVGLSLAVRAPERLNKLIVVNGFSYLDPALNRAFEALIALARDSGRETFVRALPLFTYPANWASENEAFLEDRFLEHVAEYAGEHSLERRIAAMRAFNIEPHLNEIDHDVLVIGADDDALVPGRCARRLAEGLPRATLKTLRYGGHACNVAAPEEFEQVVLDWFGYVPVTATPDLAAQ